MAVQRDQPAGIDAIVFDQRQPIPAGTAPAEAETHESRRPLLSAIGIRLPVGVAVGWIPWSMKAFRLATWVDEAIMKGGVPVETDELIWPEIARPVLPIFAPRTLGTPADVDPPMYDAGLRDPVVAMPLLPTLMPRKLGTPTVVEPPLKLPPLMPPVATMLPPTRMLPLTPMPDAPTLMPRKLGMPFDVLPPP
jgi:hypothetical protein